jgi:hypothetical protein
MAVAVGLAAAGDARAQLAPPEAPPPVLPQAAPTAPAPSAPGDRGRQAAVDARYKVRIMEGVLEKSVQQAALRLNEQLQRVSPDLIQLAGAAHARGYRLEGYGLFFDVEVPAAMRQSMGWTARVMRQQQQGVNEALGSLRRLTGELDPKQQAEAERAMKQLEAVVRPMPRRRVVDGMADAPPPMSSGGAAVSTTTTLPPAPMPPPAAGETADGKPVTVTAPGADALLWSNPDLAYEEHVREALIGAMLEWGALLPLGPDEWLTVAARDNQDVIMPGAAPDVVTIILRVKGSDLAERIAGRVPLDELRRRVEVREF